jgi:hypothetical protein
LKIKLFESCTLDEKFLEKPILFWEKFAFENGFKKIQFNLEVMNCSVTSFTPEQAKKVFSNYHYIDDMNFVTKSIQDITWYDFLIDTLCKMVDFRKNNPDFSIYSNNFYKNKGIRFRYEGYDGLIKSSLMVENTVFDSIDCIADYVHKKMRLENLTNPPRDSFELAMWGRFYVEDDDLKERIYNALLKHFTWK